MKTKQKGFTLLEILLVVGIIAILAGIVIVAINPARQIGAARDSERKQMIATINKAVNLYYIDKGHYPGLTTAINSTTTEICNTGDTASTTLSGHCTNYLNLSQLVPDYITSIPIDPTAPSGFGTGYRIALNSSGNIYIDAPLAQLATTSIGSSVGVTILGEIGGDGGDQGGSTLGNGLVAHYKMNDTNGTTVVDSIGGNNGTGSYTGTTGLIGGALSFSGSNVINVIDSGFLPVGNNSRTVAMWFKTTQDYNRDGVMTLFGYGSGGSNGYEVDYYPMPSGVRTWTASGQVNAYDSGSLNNGQWHFIVSSYDSSSGEISISVDNGTPGVLSVGSLNTNSTNLLLGGGCFGYDFYNYIGLIDDVRIYNRVLTQGEITELAAGTEAE